MYHVNIPRSGASMAALNSRATLVCVCTFESRQILFSSASLLFVPSKNSVTCSVCEHDIFGSATNAFPSCAAFLLSERRPPSGIRSANIKLIVLLLLRDTAGSIHHPTPPSRLADHHRAD